MEKIFEKFPRMTFAKNSALFYKTRSSSPTRSWKISATVALTPRTKNAARLLNSPMLTISFFSYLRAIKLNSLNAPTTSSCTWVNSRGWQFSCKLAVYSQRVYWRCRCFQMVHLLKNAFAEYHVRLALWHKSLQTPSLLFDRSIFIIHTRELRYEC